MKQEATTQPDGIEALISVVTSHRGEEYQQAYGAMVDRLREFLDALAGAEIDIEQAHQLEEFFAGWTPQLQQLDTDDLKRPWGHLIGHDGHGQTLVPRIYDPVYRHDELHGKVVLGRFHVGENMAAHGGAIGLVFDDFLGWMMLKTGMPPSRTAYLKTNFRSLTPIGEELTLHAWVDRVEGRKRFVKGELRHGETLCADAEGLWVELLPGQG